MPTNLTNLNMQSIYLVFLAIITAVSSIATPAPATGDVQLLIGQLKGEWRKNALTLAAEFANRLFHEKDYKNEFMKKARDMYFKNVNEQFGGGWSVSLVSRGFDFKWDNCIEDNIRIPGAVGSYDVKVLLSNRDRGFPCGWQHCGDGGDLNWSSIGWWNYDDSSNGCKRIWQ